MSGGSYNYLHTHAGGLEAQRGEIEEMRDRLDGLASDGLPGAAEAASQTRAILQHFDQAEELAQGLSGVWRAVEWWDSCDGGEDDVREALTEMLAKAGGPDGGERAGTEGPGEAAAP
ncbi:hypothetical protein [Streptomyces umbrinus]|uniref:hypothetical protein n=1 Tax=Streptomyces umbrinus TaxID=67370 RepID=UPI00341FC4F1